MTERTSGELERDAEQIRAGIAQTAEALQDRMSPGKMVDEFMAYIKESDGTLALDNLRRQARENPMALAMIGSGFAWLMFGGGGAASSASPKRTYAADYADDSPRRASETSGPESSWDLEGGVSGAASTLGESASGITQKASGLLDRATGAAGEATDRVRAAAGAATDRVRAAGGAASDRARHLRHDAIDRGSAAAEGARDMAGRGRDTIIDALDREPLVLGAIGVAVGAALGAMLPGTRFENETFGKTRDDLVRGAETVVDRAAETARNVAGEALQAAKAASKDEGLVIEGKAVAERVGEVAKAALSAGKDAAERELKAPENGEPALDETLPYARS